MIKNQAIGNSSNRMFLVLALLLGAASAVLIGVFLVQAQGDGATGGGSGPQLPVVVAAQDIPQFTRITPEMLAVKDVPVDLVLVGAFTATDAAVGQVAQTAILAGEQIVPSRIAEASATGQLLEADDLADVVPIDKITNPCDIPNCGLRAISVGVSPASAGAGLIRPGDQVDIIAAFKDGSAVTVVTDVEVLAIDRDFDRSEDGSILTEGEENPAAAVATLSLWPDQVQKVAAAEEMTLKSNNCEGSLRLSLRHTGKTGTFDVPIGQGFCAQLFALAWGLQVAPVPAQLVPQD